MKRPIFLALLLLTLAVLMPAARASAQPHSVPIAGIAEEVEAYTRWQSLGDGYTRSYDRNAEIYSFFQEKASPSKPRTHAWEPFVDANGRAFWRKEDTHGWTYYNAREWAGLRFRDAPGFAAWHKASRIQEPAKRAGVVLTANGQWMTEGVLRDEFRREYSAGKYLGPGQVEPDAGAGDAADVEGRCKDDPSLLNLWGIPASIAGIPTLMFILGLTVIIGGMAMLVFFGLLIALIVWLVRKK